MRMEFASQENEKIDFFVRLFLFFLKFQRKYRKSGDFIIKFCLPDGKKYIFFDGLI